MPIKPDITNASDALWSAAVERERLKSADLKSRRRPRSWTAMVYRPLARYRRDPHTSANAKPFAGSPIRHADPR
jgi:hypothetical protein